jgi:hypothetical protein
MRLPRYVAGVSPVEALHTAARRYCVDRAALWSRQYADLQTREAAERRRSGVPEPTTYTYSAEALSTFPRYQVLQAIQWAVEAFTPADFSSLAEARELLAAAGDSAESVMTRPPHGEIEQQAMDEERALFAAFVRRLSEDELAQVEPLPFRRTLTADESKHLWSELRTRWGIEGFYWYPLDRPDTVEPPQNSVALGADPFFDAEVQARLRDVLAGLGVSRMWELRELDTDADCEIDLELFEPIYTGAEGFWTDGSLDWLIYASHESSVTVAGARLLPAFQQAFPDWLEWTYAPDW